MAAEKYSGFDATGQHGLIAATSNQSTSMRWYAGTNGDTRAYGDGIGAGEMNTAIIIAAQVAIGDDGSTYAARVCADLVISNYSDWYLPSKYELNLMFLQKATIGNFTSNFYWSSTERNSNTAWAQRFSDGNQIGNFVKTNSDYVRAVRAF